MVANLLIVGKTGSGMTSLMNELKEFIRIDAQYSIYAMGENQFAVRGEDEDGGLREVIVSEAGIIDFIDTWYPRYNHPGWNTSSGYYMAYIVPSAELMSHIHTNQRTWDNETLYLDKNQDKFDTLFKEFHGCNIMNEYGGIRRAAHDVFAIIERMLI